MSNFYKKNTLLKLLFHTAKSSYVLRLQILKWFSPPTTITIFLLQSGIYKIQVFRIEINFKPIKHQTQVFIDLIEAQIELELKVYKY